MNVEIVNGSDNKIAITLPTTQNVITVQPTALVASSISDAADVNLAADITVSNTDGAFTHVTSFSAGTSVESVLRQILEKYNRTTITLSGISRALQNTDGTYPVSSSEVTSGS